MRSVRLMRTLPLVIAPLLIAACGSGGGDSNPSAPTAPPAGGGGSPVSSVSGTITGVTFDWASHRREAPGSDNWPLTWADDDHQYAVWGDGGGFKGDDADGRASFGMARIEGTHDAYRGVNRFGGKSRECPSNISGKGHGAPISIGGGFPVELRAEVVPQRGARLHTRLFGQRRQRFLEHRARHVHGCTVTDGWRCNTRCST